MGCGRIHSANEYDCESTTAGERAALRKASERAAQEALEAEQEARRVEDTRTYALNALAVLVIAICIKHTLSK